MLEYSSVGPRQGRKPKVLNHRRADKPSIAVEGIQMKPCKKCGSVERYANNKCKPCSLADTIKWQKENREKVNSKNNKWKTAKRAKLRVLYPEKTRQPNAKTPAERIERRKAVQAKYALTHREKIVEKSRKRKAENPEAERERLRKWKADHPEKMRASRAKYWAERPDARRIYNQNRRAKEVGNGGTLSVGIVQKLFKLQRGKCACCGESLGRDFHLDHILPVALGGQSADANMQLLRKSCNLKKNATHPIDFMRSRGFLL
jgi:hypothetical protein